MNKHCALCNICDCCTLAGEQEEKCIGYTYYANDDESRDMEKGTYRGYEWKIRTNWGQYPSAYVYIPNDNPLYEIVVNDYTDIYVPVHCGLSMGGGMKDGRAIIGWDYGHLDDYQPRNSDEGGKRWLRSEILTEIERCIDKLIDLVERKKEEDEEHQRQEKEWKEKRDVICHPSRGREIYRAVGESDRDWHPCYECGHMEVIRDVSPWFLDEACARAWVFENSHERKYIETSMVYDDIFFESVEH